MDILIKFYLLLYLNKVEIDNMFDCVCNLQISAYKIVCFDIKLINFK